MRAEIKKIEGMMEAAEYVTDPAIAMSVHLAMTLKKPLLIEGHAGVGKTEVAKVMAKMLETNLIRLQCYEGLDAAQALYEWNYPKQLLHIKLEESTPHTMSEKEAAIFSPPFLIRRPLLQAISATGTVVTRYTMLMIRFPSHDVDRDVDVSPCGLGIGTRLMRGIHNGSSDVALHARQADVEASSEEPLAARAAQVHFGVNRRVGR